jgi:hypothetical protein
MLTYFAMEIISKDRLREVNKEAMKRVALREAFGDRRNQILLFPKLWCRLSSFWRSIWLPKDIWLHDLDGPRELDPCVAMD